jgi:hypothetical protein
MTTKLDDESKFKINAQRLKERFGSWLEDSETEQVPEATKESRAAITVPFHSASQTTIVANAIRDSSGETSLVLQLVNSSATKLSPLIRVDLKGPVQLSVIDV